MRGLQKGQTAWLGKSEQLQAELDREFQLRYEAEDRFAGRLELETAVNARDEAIAWKAQLEA
jgi:hypothetical protein